MKRIIMLVLCLAFILSLVVPAVASEGKVYGYITPGPDTWYKRDVDGFIWGAKMVGADTIVLNSDYDVQKEVSNIESLITQGVDGMVVFSFNQQGAITAAKKCKEAGIPLVVVDNVGQVFETDQDVVAAVDFDWAAMGNNYAEYMAENYPGDKIAIISGLLEHRPVQVINSTMEKRVKELGENEIVVIREGQYNPSVAVNQVQDLVQSGLSFDIIWVMNEDMAAAVIRYLDNYGLLDEYTVIAQNGSPVGIPAIKQGKLDYTISSSPGWEGLISLLALHQNVMGDSDSINQQLMLPVIPVTKENIEDKTKVVPWEVDPVMIDLTKEYFPELGSYLPEAEDAPEL